jgi:hypothetical protein
MRKKIHRLILVLVVPFQGAAFPQCTGSGGCALQLYNAVFVSMDGGSSGTPIIINIAQAGTGGIYSPTIGTTGVDGHIYSEGQYNAVNWQTNGTGANSTGRYIFPFGDNSIANYLSFDFYKTVASGSASSGADQIMVATQGLGNTNVANSGGSNNAGSTNVLENNTPYFSPVTTMTARGGGNATTSTIDRWYQITTPAATSISAVVSFPYKGVENSTSNPTGTFVAQEWNTATPGWDYPISPGSTGSSAAARDSVIAGTTLAPILFNGGAAHSYSGAPNNAQQNAAWVLSEMSDPLPITLLDFSVFCEKNTVRVDWSTATETNNSYFTIERSADGIHFGAIEQIKGAGNSSILINYQTTVNDSSGANYYYRLEQTDYDGKSTFSGIAATNCGGNGTPGGVFAVFPSPSSGECIYVKIQNLTPQEQVLVVLIDMLGQVIYSKIGFCDSNGFMMETIGQSRHISPGVYTVVGSTQNNSYKQKIIIK